MKLKRLLASSGALVLATSASSALIACGPALKQDNHQQTMSYSFYYQPQNKSFAMINEASAIGEIASQEAQILLLASQFGLSQDEVSEIMGFDTKGFLSTFDLTSLETLTKDAQFHQSLGQKGALLSLATGKDRFEIDNPIATNIFKGALGHRHVTGTSYSSQELAKTVDYFMNVIYPFTMDANLAKAIKGVSSLLNFIELSPEDAKSAQEMAKKAIDSKVTTQYIQPLLTALMTGTDLSRFAEMTPAVFMAQMANQIANLLGYATIEGYAPVTETSERIDQASEVINTFVKNQA